MSIIVDNISYIYEKGTGFERQALKNVNCAIEDGEFIGLGYGYKLYNLKEDISQQNNLAEKYPELLGKLINRFEYLKGHTDKVTRY